MHPAKARVDVDVLCGKRGEQCREDRETMVRANDSWSWLHWCRGLFPSACSSLCHQEALWHSANFLLIHMYWLFYWDQQLLSVCETVTKRNRHHHQSLNQTAVLIRQNKSNDKCQGGEANPSSQWVKADQPTRCWFRVNDSLESMEKNHVHMGRVIVQSTLTIRGERERLFVFYTRLVSAHKLPRIVPRP